MDMRPQPFLFAVAASTLFASCAATELSNPNPRDGGALTDLASSDAPFNLDTGTLDSGPTRDANTSDAAGAPDASADASTTGTSGCGVPHSAGASTESIVASALSREYALNIPAGYDPSVPARVVFGFHGAASNGPDFRAWVGAQLEPLAGSSAIFVYPTGTVIDGRTGWDTGRSGIDTALVEAILDELAENYCIDTTRVFAFGFSWGGGMAHAMGCYRTGAVRAIAVGSGWWGFNGCDGPMPAWIFHSSNDEINDYATWGLPGRDHWIEANVCNAESTTPHAPTPCVQYDGCETSPVVWCTNDTDGHAWPAWMSAGVWEFFSGF